MLGILCTFIYLLLSSLFSPTSCFYVQNEYRFLPHSLLHNQTESPKILFRRFKHTEEAYLFIANVNKISQLNPENLSLLSQRVIGPKNFSIFCYTPGDHCIPVNQLSNRPLPQGYRQDYLGPRLTNAFVKSWATSNFEPTSPVEGINVWIDNQPANNDFLSAEDALYVCYNVFHGFCERLQLTNISNSIPWTRQSSLMDFYPKRSPDIPIPVVNWNASLASTLTVDGSYIFVGLEQDEFQDTTLVVLDPISLRMRDFDYASREPSEKSSLRFRDIELRVKYKFSFQYTLEHGSSGSKHLYVYFVAQQPNKTLPGMLETRLVRFCSTLLFFHSYVDLQLLCNGCVLPGRGRALKQFGALHMAVRGTVGSGLATKRHSELVKSRSVPKWRRPINLSEDFNNVLLVAFASQLLDLNDYTSMWSRNFESKKPIVRGTAIAFYTMAEIDVYFGIVVYNCLTGRTSTGPSYLSDYPQKCDRDDFLLPTLKQNSYCPTEPMNYPISGSLSSERLSAPPVLMLDVDVTGMAITRIAEDFTVLVITTDEGELAKYEVEDDGKARLITSKQLTSRRRPLRGLTLDDTGHIAFAISDEKVYRVALYNCSSSESCGACLALRDPFCGWCAAQGICTHKSACSSFYWLSYRTSPSSCPQLTSINPHSTDINQNGSSLARTVLTLRLVPELLEAFLNTMDWASEASSGHSRRILCTFRNGSSSKYVEPARRIRGKLYAQFEASLIPGSYDATCSLPSNSDLQVLGADEEYTDIDIWLEMTESTSSESISHPLASGKFLIYGCGRFTTCKSCLNPRFSCVWHLGEGRCLSHVGSSTSSALSSSANSNSLIFCAKSNCSCPSFEAEKEFITIEANLPVSVVLTVSNVQALSKRFSCSESCTGRWTEGIYDSTASTVTCAFSGIALKSDTNTNESTGYASGWHPNLMDLTGRGVVGCEIAISWLNGRLTNQPKLSHHLVNSQTAFLEVYNCSLMAVHCDSCLALPHRFSCAWCSTVAGGAAGCFKTELCAAKPGPWRSCPHPQLLQVIPENATLEGRTQLTIRGVNLGYDAKDLTISVVLLDYDYPPIPCSITPSDFLPSRQVACRLQPRYYVFEKPSKLTARIELNLMHEDQLLNASLPFTFLYPVVNDISPKCGPSSGGTIMKFRGQYLNAGASVEVYLSDVKCDILSLSSNLLTCQTRAIDRSLLPLATESERGVGCEIALHFDDSRVRSIPPKFFFTPDPKIRTVTKTLIFRSGGTTIRVFGQHLDVIEHPQIVFYHNGMEYIESCQPTLGYLSCLSPSLDRSTRRKRNLEELESGTRVRPITNPLVTTKLFTYEHDDEMAMKSADKMGKALLVTYGFIMDNVTDLLVFGVVPVYPNPEIFPFTDGRLVESFSSPSLFGLSKESSKTPFIEAEQPAFLNGTSGENSPSLQDRHLLRFHGNFEALTEVSDVHALDELSINIVTEGGENGASRPCKPTVVKLDEIRCELNRRGLVEGMEYPVFIQFGKYLMVRPGVLQFKRLSPLGVRDRAIIVACSVIGILTLIVCLFLAMWFRSRKTERDLEKRFQSQWIEQEKCVARAFKNDFIELQTHVDELVQDLNKGSLPVRDYQTYCLFSLFPEYHLSLVRPANPHNMPPYLPRPSMDVFGDSTMNGAIPFKPHPLISSFEVSANVQESADRGIYLFNRLLHDRRFLCLLVGVIESNINIDARAKSQIASLLSIILHPDMEYFTQIILALITDLLRDSRDHGGDSRLLTAFRRAESVVAKMLSNWLTFLLYNFIREHAAEHLFILYRALRQQINTGPQDAVTGLARYTLDAATLLKSDLLSRKITLLVVDPEELFGHLCPPELQVRVLLCDTVTQTKEKILDTIYRNTPYRNQLRPTDVHLRKMCKAFGNGNEFSPIDLLMMDWDLEVRRNTPNAGLDGPPYRLNCLSDYKMNDGDVVALVRAKSPSNGSGTLPTNPVASSWGIHSCPPMTDGGNSLPIHLRPTSLPPSKGLHQQVVPHAFNIRPTGGPSPHLWYHLERPTSTDLVQIERGGRTRDASLEGKPSLCCRPSTNSCATSQRPSSTLPLVLTPTQQQQQQQIGGGLDTRSLRRWLVSGSGSQSTAERTRTSLKPSHRRTRRPNRRLFRKLGGCGGPSETVELAPSWAEEQDDAIDRPMTKLPCEIFLNRLLRTRVSVAKYMDRVFELIFGSVVDSQSPPLCIKFLFDFLDFQADSLGIHDPGVLHAWKANCLHLRFWNQILINLDYVFDIPLPRNTALERSFHSFSQAITYACSPVLDKVTMDSPINKALFSSDIEHHWSTVKSYFKDIKALPPISSRDMNFSLAQHSKHHRNDFNVSWALYELYTRHVELCYDTLVSELETAIEAGTVPTADVSYNAMGDTIRHPYYDFTGSLHGGVSLSESQNVNWDPLSLLQSLKEVNSCMNAVAASTTTNNSNGKASTLKTPNSAANNPLLQRHSHRQPANGNGAGAGGGGGCAGVNVAALRSAVPHSERRLPPLPTLP